MRALELFAGYGGLLAAVEAALGAETVAVAEVDPVPGKVLAHRWPGAPNLGDVTTIDWASLSGIDVVSGGSPCTDVSLAGARAGMAPGTRSNLWVAQRDAIAALRPRFVVWENVRGALTTPAASLTDPTGARGALTAAGRVLGDLASLGYDAEWAQVKASEVGACHSRARIFLLAWDADQVAGAPVDRAPAVAWHPDRDRFETPHGTPGGVTPVWGAMRGGGLHPRRGPVMRHQTPRLLPTPTASDQYGPGAHGDGGADLRTVAHRLGPGRWGPYSTAIARHTHLLHLPPPPAPVETGRRGGDRQLAATFCEWMMGLEPGWVTHPRYGLYRRQHIRMLGNGVMPVQAEKALGLLAARAGLADTISVPPRLGAPCHAGAEPPTP